MNMMRIIFYITLFLFATPVLSSMAESIAIIVNKSNQADNISSVALSNFYKGLIEKGENGQRVIVVNRPKDDKIREKFYKIILRSKATKKFYKTGSPLPFKTLTIESDRAMLRFVSRIPNSIGYMYLSEVDDTVKVLKVNGIAPSLKDYVLGN